MSNRSERRRKIRKSQEISLSKQIQTEWGKRLPIFLFIGGFLLIMICFYLFELTAFYESNVFTPIAKLNAFLSAQILNILGFETIAQGVLVSSPEFRISIQRGCDALAPMTLLSAGIIAFPASTKNKLIGIVLGVLFLFCLNQVRIITLFLTGLYIPDWFEIMHVEIWQVCFIIIALFAWVVWIRFVLKTK